MVGACDGERLTEEEAPVVSIRADDGAVVVVIVVLGFID